MHVGAMGTIEGVERPGKRAAGVQEPVGALGEGTRGPGAGVTWASGSTTCGGRTPRAGGRGGGNQDGPGVAWGLERAADARALRPGRGQPGRGGGRLHGRTVRPTRARWTRDGTVRRGFRGPGRRRDVGSDQGGRGGSRIPDICLVSGVAAPAGCVATIAIRASRGHGRRSDRECARWLARSGTPVARGPTACEPCTPDRPSPSGMTRSQSKRSSGRLLPPLLRGVQVTKGATESRQPPRCGPGRTAIREALPDLRLRPQSCSA